MLRRLPRLPLALSLLSLVGCATSTHELPGTASALRATVEAEFLTTPHVSHHSIRVVLADANGMDVERNDVRVEVNGIPMRFLVGQGNYYDRHPFYVLDDDDHFALKSGAEYHIVVIYPDSTRHEIGTLRMPAALSPDQIDFPSKAPSSGPVTIGWRDLTEPAELRIGRMEERRVAENQFVIEGTGPNDPEALHRTIGPGEDRPSSDRLTIPARLLVSDQARTLLSLNAELVVATAGRVAPGVSRETTLTARRRIQLEMEFSPAH